MAALCERWQVFLSPLFFSRARARVYYRCVGVGGGVVSFLKNMCQNIWKIQKFYSSLCWFGKNSREKTKPF